MSCPFRARCRLAVTALEDRRVPAGVTAAAILNGLHDPGIRNLAKALDTDGQLGRTDLIALFRQAEKDGTLRANELADLRTIVGNAGTLRLPDAVRVLAGKVVNGDPANAHYRGAALGNVAAGSSARQLEELVDKWFLGSDHPALPNGLKSADGSVTPFAVPVGYAAVGGSLFRAAGPSAADVDQGQSHDCYLLAALAETAARSPGTIKNMFTDNGDGTFAVRLFHDGRTDYVTVDRFLPVVTGTGRAIFAKWVDTANLFQGLWVALAEKAYAQMNESGWLNRSRDSQFVPGQPVSHNGVNAYAEIEFGQSATALAQVAGGTAAVRALNALTDRGAIVRALQAGRLVTLASNVVTEPDIVAGHVYAVTGYDAATQTFALYNPWGVGTSSADPGWLTLSWDRVVANFGWWTAAA